MKILRICRQGGDVRVFENKEELRKQLCNFHSIDWQEGIDKNDKDYIDVYSLSLDDIMEHGEWSYKEITDEEAKEIDEGYLPIQSNEYTHV